MHLTTFSSSLIICHRRIVEYRTSRSQSIGTRSRGISPSTATLHSTPNGAIPYTTSDTEAESIYNGLNSVTNVAVNGILPVPVMTTPANPERRSLLSSNGGQAPQRYGSLLSNEVRFDIVEVGGASGNTTEEEGSEGEERGGEHGHGHGRGGHDDDNDIHEEEAESGYGDDERESAGETSTIKGQSPVEGLLIRIDDDSDDRGSIGSGSRKSPTRTRGRESERRSVKSVGSGSVSVKGKDDKLPAPTNVATATPGNGVNRVDGKHTEE
ncbi:hypothetical protein C8Q75DRAFT_293754 [Abortiporus biennis]|nr:hypothetical protein C8Q75DRAFT_293754 [Abortiporus biennis]